MLNWVCFLLGLLAILGALLNRIYPEAFAEIEMVLKRAGYKNSKLQDVNIQKLEKRLLQLMEDERIFTQEDLTLRELSGLAGVKPYQLTEFLNIYQGQNFPTFINQYRVHAAAELLLSGGKVNILNTAFRVGFNNKASFNSSFRKIMGCTPTVYIQMKKQEHE